MPFINRQGNIAHGVAGVGAYLNNQLFDHGGGACWVDARTIAYQHDAHDGTYLALYDIHSNVYRRAFPDPSSPFYGKGANTIAAGGGMAAAWLAGFGLFTTTGIYLPGAGLIAVTDNGALIYIENYQNGVPVRVRELDGTDWLLSDTPVLDADGYGQGQILWIDYSYRIHTVGMPVPAIVGATAARPRAAQLASGEWWISYFSSDAGVVLHPFDSTVGYSIKATGDCWQDVSALDSSPTAIGVAWSRTQGEAAGEVTFDSIDVATAPRTDFSNPQPPDPEPPDPEPPDPEPPDPEPPDPEDDMKPPVVTVDSFTLDDVLDGREIRFHDDGNPELQISGRVFVEGDSMRVTLTNKAGSATTGAQRTVHPCSQGTQPQPPDPQPPDPPQPEPQPQFSLYRENTGYLNVDQEMFLYVDREVGATFEEVALPNGTIGLKCNGYFVACEGDKRLKADRTSAGDWEYWLRENGEGAKTVAYRSWMDTFISAHDDGTCAADQTEIGGWETFQQKEPMSGRPPIKGAWHVPSKSRYFVDQAGAAVRYMGVSAFRACRDYTDGKDIRPFLNAFAGFNVLRVWDYVTWEGTGWECCTVEQWKAFLSFVRQLGWRVELTLLTDDDAKRIEPARALVQGLSGIDNLLIEIGNEPDTHKDIDCEAVRSACDASGLPYSSGHYEDSACWFGTYGTAHTPRDDNWPRKAHDLLEYYRGGGPSYPTEPACPAPWIADEPIRPDQAQSNWNPKVIDFRGYGGTASLLGGGALFHFDGGKYGALPTPDDCACRDALLEGLMAFPPNAPDGPYSTVDEGGESDDDARGSRTYIVGNCMCRVRPVGTTPPQPGWTSLDPDGVLFIRGSRSTYAEPAAVKTPKKKSKPVAKKTAQHRAPVRRRR